MEEHNIIIVNAMYYCQWNDERKWGRPGNESCSTHSKTFLLLVNSLPNKYSSLKGTFSPFVQGRREVSDSVPTNAHDHFSFTVNPPMFSPCPTVSPYRLCKNYPLKPLLETYHKMKASCCPTVSPYRLCKNYPLKPLLETYHKIKASCCHETASSVKGFNL